MYVVKPPFASEAGVELPPPGQIYRMPPVGQLYPVPPTGQCFPVPPGAQICGEVSSHTGQSSYISQLSSERPSSMNLRQITSELEEMQLSDGRKFQRTNSELEMLQRQQAGSLTFRQMHSELVQIQGEEMGSFNFHRVGSELEQLQCESVLSLHKMASEIGQL